MEASEAIFAQVNGKCFTSSGAACEGRNIPTGRVKFFRLLYEMIF